MAAQGQNRKQRLPTSASAERRIPAVHEVNLVAGSDLMLRSLCIGGYLSKLLLHGGARSLCGGAILYAEERFMPVHPNAALQFTRVQGELGADSAVDLVTPL